MQVMTSDRSSISAEQVSRRALPGLVAVAIGVCLAIGVGLLLLGVDPTVGLFFPLVIGVILLAFRWPYWALTIGLAQLAFIPQEGHLFGYFVPNTLQLLAPLAVTSALFQALRRRDHELLRPRVMDFLIGAFGLWGFVGMFLNGVVRLKSYGNNVIFVMFWYYAIRLLPLNRKNVQRLLFILLGATALQSVLMVHESLNWASPLYGTPSADEILEGVAAAIGPFGFHWGAGAYLCMWPSIAIYAIARTRRWRGKLVWFAALMVILAAAIRTMQRASVAASLLAIMGCLINPKLRPTALGVIGILAIAYIPWSTGSFGAPLMTRFRETDQSRYARRVAAVNLMKSPRWNPIYGIGWLNFSNFNRGFGTEEEIVAWGRYSTTVEAAASGSALHNVWWAIPVEYGVVGTLMFLGILAGLGHGTLRIWRNARTGAKVDDGLLIAMLGSLVALGMVGYYHNIYSFDACMCIFWAFYALLTSHPDSFLEPEARQTASESAR